MGRWHKRNFADLVKLENVRNALCASTKWTRRDAQVARTKLVVITAGGAPLKKFTPPLKTIDTMTHFCVSLGQIKPNIDTPLPMPAQIILTGNKDDFVSGNQHGFGGRRLRAGGDGHFVVHGGVSTNVAAAIQKGNWYKNFFYRYYRLFKISNF